MVGAVRGGDLLRAGDNFAVYSDVEGANTCYNAAMIEDPGLSLDMEFLLRKSRVGRELGDAELAQAILLRAQDLAVSGRDIGQTSWLLGLDAFFVGEYEAAQGFFASALLYHPDPPVELLYYLGWSLYVTADYNAARNVFLNLSDLNRGQFDPDELDVLLAAVDFKTSNYTTVLEQIGDAPAYNRNTTYRESALHMAGYAAFRIDSLDESLVMFDSMSDSLTRILGQARIAMEQGDFNTSAELYSELSTQEAQYGQAVALYLAGKSSDAGRIASDYLENHPQGERSAETYLLLGLIERDRGRYSSSARMIERGLELASPNRPILMLELAELELHRRRYHEASVIYEDLFTSYPRFRADQMVRLDYARVLFFIGETSAAAAEFAGILSATTDEIIANQSHYYLGEVAARRGEYLTAAQEYSQVSEGSLYAQAMRRKGEVLAQAGRHREAIAAFQVSCARTSSSYDREELLLLIEESRLALGVYPDRIAMLKSFIEEYPDASQAPQLQLEIVLEYFGKSNYVSSMHECNKLLDRYPDSEIAAEAMQYKARCQRKLGRIDAAIATYREIPQRFAASSAVSRSQVELADLLLSLGRDADAMAVYRDLLSASRSGSARAGYLVNMALIYSSQGNNQSAADMVSAALAESNAADIAKRAYLVGIDIELARGNIDAADNYAQRYRNRFGETAEYLYKRARVDYVSGDLRASLTNYSQAAQRFPRRSEERIDALIGAADAAMLLGRNNDARRFLEEAALEVELDHQRVEITQRLQRLSTQ